PSIIFSRSIRRTHATRMKNAKTQKHRHEAPPLPLFKGESIYSPPHRGGDGAEGAEGVLCSSVPREPFLKITEKCGHRRAYSTSYSRSVHLPSMDENHLCSCRTSSRSSDC